MTDNYPDCKKCEKGTMLPFSGTKTMYDHGTFEATAHVITLAIAYWQCDSCSNRIDN